MRTMRLKTHRKLAGILQRLMVHLLLIVISYCNLVMGNMGINNNHESRNRLVNCEQEFSDLPLRLEWWGWMTV